MRTLGILSLLVVASAAVWLVVAVHDAEIGRWDMRRVVDDPAHSLTMDTVSRFKDATYANCVKDAQEIAAKKPPKFGSRTECIFSVGETCRLNVKRIYTTQEEAMAHASDTVGAVVCPPIWRRRIEFSVRVL